jgi:hypothetical protein
VPGWGLSFSASNLLTFICFGDSASANQVCGCYLLAPKCYCSQGIHATLPNIAGCDCTQSISDCILLQLHILLLLLLSLVVVGRSLAHVVLSHDRVITMMSGKCCVSPMPQEDSADMPPVILL